MEVVQCDKCKAIVGRNTIAKFSYRTPESMRDPYGRTVDIDICESCYSELTGWTASLKELEQENGEDGN